MRSVIENGYLYIATPPLYSVKKGKDQRYCWTEEQRLQLIQEMGAGKESSLHIQRYKGLGEMTAEQLWDTTMSPDGRTLRQDDDRECCRGRPYFLYAYGGRCAAS